MKQYLDALKKIMDEGDDRMTRNGVTRACFDLELRFNVSEGFPALTTKKLAFKSVVAELLWFLEGGTTTQLLNSIAGFETTIWRDDAKQHFEKGKTTFLGDLGPVYGKQWRRWTGYRRIPGHSFGYEWVEDHYEPYEVDQLKNVIDRIKKDPFDRRLVVSAWNVAEIDEVALPPCHMLFQFFATSDRKLSLKMIQRSCDMFLGVPFNIASYALLLHMVAQMTHHTPWECAFSLIDAHIYHDHFPEVKEQLKREPFPLPTLQLNPEITDIDSFSMKDIALLDYKHHPAIKAELLTKDIKKS